MNLWLPASTAFLASAVEAVEALTIVLAVGVTHGWRTALSGTAWALGALGLIVVAFGPVILTYVPLGTVRLVVGLFLLLFGLSWLRKAILRYGGRKALRDEGRNYASSVEQLQGDRVSKRVAFTTAFKAVFLEGLEVAVIIVTVGASSQPGLVAAALGALAAVLLVVVAGYAVHGPLVRVPENALKFAVGIMLVSFGTFWSGEGLGIAWWHEDLMLAVLVLSYGALSLLLCALLRATPRTPLASSNA